MDEVFGDATGLAVADQERQTAIHRRLGLLTDTIDEKQEGKSSHDEKTSDL